jgi:hypothetical protein
LELIKELSLCVSFSAFLLTLLGVVVRVEAGTRLT